MSNNLRCLRTRLRVLELDYYRGSFNNAIVRANLGNNTIYEKIITNQGQFQKSTKIVFRGKHVR